MTRAAEKAADLRTLGGEPVVCDVFDADRLTEAVARFQPEAVMHQLTDLPDRVEELDAYAAANDRIRSEGTRNLIAAAQAAGVAHFVAQSIAWRSGGLRDEAVDLHERLVVEIGGVVARYGRLYGPDTYYEGTPPPHPRIQVDDAVRATPPLLEAPAGIVSIVEPKRR